MKCTMYHGQFFLQPTDAVLSLNSPSIYGSGYYDVLDTSTTTLLVPGKKSNADRFTGYSLPEKLVKVKKRDNIFDLPQHAFEPKTQKQYLGYFREVFSLDKIFEKAKKSLKLFHFETIENQVKARYDW